MGINWVDSPLTRGQGGLLNPKKKATMNLYGKPQRNLPRNSAGHNVNRKAIYIGLARSGGGLSAIIQ
jgi:hypothetical protein